MLIRHEIDIFTKKTGKAIATPHKLSGTTQVRDELASGNRITSNANPWLDSILRTNNIEYVKQLNTGTLGHLYKSKFNELYDKNVIFDSERSEINEGLRHLAVNRRNNDLHFYFKASTFIDNDDLPNIYLPLTNLLLNVFYR